MPRGIVVTGRVRPDVATTTKETARRKGVSVSRFIERALDRYLAEVDGKGARRDREGDSE
jgi:hypothetical protein